MNPHNLSFTGKMVADPLPSSGPHSYTMISTYPNRYMPPVVKAKSKALPTTFTAALAHEVRNPLTNINLAVEMLAGTVNPDEVSIFLDIIRRSSTRINYLINDLLQYQEADEERPGDHSIQQLLDEVLAMAEDRVSLKQISVKREYSMTDGKALLNRPKMKIALTNIIINAIDAMPIKNGQLRLVTRMMSGQFTIRIEDNGCGISKVNLAKIFIPYFTNKPGGLGLGLAATYEILLSNKVGVQVESVVGKGTCFILLFDAHL